MEQTSRLLNYLAFFAGLLAALVPCAAPIAVVLGLIAFSRSQDKMGKIVSGAAVALGIGFLVMYLLVTLGVIGLNGLAVCCVMCSETASY